MKKHSENLPNGFRTYKGVNFLIQKNGKIYLHPKRINKLNKGLEKLDNAEQYALKCLKSDQYDCFPCAVFFYSSKKIYLEKENVWRYGVTELGQKARGYSEDWLIENGLKYVIQFEGNIRDCLYQEREKIFNYALLTENLERKRPIIRPPGNKNDR